MTRPTIRPTTHPDRPERRPPLKVPKQRREEDTATIDGLDALLDEIDAVLEANPLETVRQFHQKSGQ